MTYKNREVQPELFSTVKKKEKKSFLHKNIFQDNYRSSFTVSCDTLIVITIALLMVNLSSFAIGIEKGKSLAEETNKEIIKKTLTNKRQIELLAVEKPKATEQKTAASIEPQYVSAVKTPEKSAPVLNTDQIGYIIQLVTYSSDSNAAKEAEKLRAEGFRSNVRKSGEYFIVYSGTYDSKTSAIEKLPVLKKRYKDCFVRFLKNT